VNIPYIIDDSCLVSYALFLAHEKFLIHIFLPDLGLALKVIISVAFSVTNGVMTFIISGLYKIPRRLGQGQILGQLGSFLIPNPRALPTLDEISYGTATTIALELKSNTAVHAKPVCAEQPSSTIFVDESDFKLICPVIHACYTNQHKRGSITSTCK
jgi:hypothetical protein